MMRWMTLSILPPKYADAAPMMAPSVQPVKADDRPMIRAVRAPQIRRENMSRGKTIGAGEMRETGRQQHFRQVVLDRIVGQLLPGKDAGEQHHKEREQRDRACRLPDAEVDHSHLVQEGRDRGVRLGFNAHASPHPSPCARIRAPP